MSPRNTKPALMLAQYAQALPNGIVNIMGGGLTMLPATPTVVFIAGVLELSWDAAISHRQHSIRFELLDDQGHPVENEHGPVFVEGKFSVAPAPGLKRGTPLQMPISQPVGPLALAADARFEWRYEIDGETHEDWSLGFTTMPEAQSQAA